MPKYCVLAILLFVALRPCSAQSSESPRVTCEVQLIKQMTEKEAQKVQNLPLDEIGKLVASRTKTLGTFDPTIGEEVEAVKTYDIPGKEKLKVTVSIFFTDEDLDGDSTKVALFVGKRESPDPMWELESVSAKTNQFWIDQPITPEEEKDPGFVRGTPILSVMKNIQVDGVRHLVAFDCSRPHSKTKWSR
jgi:hypothetical protein